MKAKEFLLAALLASAVNVSTSELDSAYDAFVQDFKAEEACLDYCKAVGYNVVNIEENFEKEFNY